MGSVVNVGACCSRCLPLSSKEIITIKQYMISGVLDSEMVSLSAIVFVSGLMYFFILQCAIQKTMSPALRTPAVPR